MPSLFLISISILAFFAVLTIALGATSSVRERGFSFWNRRKQESQKALEDLFIRNVSANEIIGGMVGGAVVAALIVWLLTGSFLFATGGAAIIVLLPGPVFSYLRLKRRHKIEEQLPAVLDQLTSSTKANLTLVQAIEEASNNSLAPISEEFRSIAQEYNLGTPLKLAINTTRGRIGSPAFDLVATALTVNIEKGGNLPEALVTMSVSLKEIWRLEQKIITASAEGRKAVKVISVTPILLFIMITISQPDLIEPLTSTMIGWVLLFIAVVIYAMALWWLRRILRIDI